MIANESRWVGVTYTYLNSEWGHITSYTMRIDDNVLVDCSCWFAFFIRMRSMEILTINQALIPSTDNRLFDPILQQNARKIATIQNQYKSGSIEIPKIFTMPNSEMNEDTS